MNSHQCGTVVAGHDPASSVLDLWRRAHEVESLGVVDGGFFPSSAAMNPALTIARLPSPAWPAREPVEHPILAA
jgi:choline dehydrogenase-like flavoprotein